MARDLGFKPVDGDEYYFISYNSEDCNSVSDYALRMHNSGIPLWYDRGIEYGEQWEEIIGKKIAGCKALIFFFTVGMLQKDNSYAIKEYRIARRMDKDVYIFLIDKLESKLWKLYPQKGSFLDDIDQTHFPDDFNALIAKLTNGNVEVNENIKEKAIIKKIPIDGIQIVDSEYLLNNNYCTPYEISKRHVELDYLTVDEKMFPEALEVEGDAETWEEMITQTADCSANLIINNDLVGYIDFFPVTPENYEKLKTEPFNDSYVAFYTFGGRYDIFVSMFSIDPKYSTSNNILLFIKWMVNRILNWREDNIYIGKIEFSIYSRHQAKALESLGFKLILTNALKGMLYEIRVPDLLNTTFIKQNFRDRNTETYKLEICDLSNKEVINECLSIASSLSYKNGGMIQYENAAAESDSIIYATYQDEIAGYLCLKNYDVFPKGIYIEQIAIRKEHQRLGLGETLVEKAITFIKENGVQAIYLNCKKVNHASYNLFTHLGFKEFKMSEEQYLGIGISKEDIEKNVALEYELSGI